jgi:hypothetical protein
VERNKKNPKGKQQKNHANRVKQENRQKHKERNSLDFFNV